MISNAENDLVDKEYLEIDQRELALENDEISPHESAFLQGYDEQIEEEDFWDIDS